MNNLLFFYKLQYNSKNTENRINVRSFKLFAISNEISRFSKELAKNLYRVLITH